MSVLSAPAYDHHELVAFHEDEASGLRAIIAVHNTALGPAVGGCRMFDYASDEEALHDVLRLSRGMTYKSALAGLPLGGGKSVIIGDPHRDKSPALMRAMGDFIQSQGGRYVAAEDSGTGVQDISVMAERTSWVSGLTDNDKLINSMAEFLSLKSCNGLSMSVLFCPAQLDDCSMRDHNCRQ